MTPFKHLPNCAGAFALTFDDGPGPDTAQLAQYLARYDARGTFFVLGENLEAPTWWDHDPALSTEIVVGLLRQGHTIGNHSYSHPTSAAAAAAMSTFIAEVTRTDDLINALRSRADLDRCERIPFRLPYGPLHIALPHVGPPAYLKDPRLAIIEQLGRPHVHWTATFEDWEPIEGGPAELAERLVDHVSQQCQKGEPAVLLLHDGAPRNEPHPYRTRAQTVEAMPIFLEAARRNGWTDFVL